MPTEYVHVGRPRPHGSVVAPGRHLDHPHSAESGNRLGNQLVLVVAVPMLPCTARSERQHLAALQQHCAVLMTPGDLHDLCVCQSCDRLGRPLVPPCIAVTELALFPIPVPACGTGESSSTAPGLVAGA